MYFSRLANNKTFYATRNIPNFFSKTNRKYLTPVVLAPDNAERVALFIDTRSSHPVRVVRALKLPTRSAVLGNDKRPELCFKRYCRIFFVYASGRHKNTRLNPYERHVIDDLNLCQARSDHVSFTQKKKKT